MNGLIVETFDTFLLDDGLALGVMLLEVHECPRAFACRKTAHVVVVLPQPVFGVLCYPLVENIEGLAPDDIGVHRSVYI